MNEMVPAAVSKSVGDGVVGASSTTAPVWAPDVIETTSLVPVMVIVTTFVAVEPWPSSTVTV